MAPAVRAAVISIVLAGAGACSSGGGGGGPPPPSTVTFTSFSAITPNQTVIMDGTAVTANATGTTDAAGDVTVNTVNFTPQGSGTLRLTYDANRALSGILIDAPQPNSDVSFDRNGLGQSIRCSNATCVGSNPVASVAVIDPFHPATNWNYQSFGVWAFDTSTTSAVFGAVSAGSPTPGNTVLQMTGPAVFNGLTAGLYVDSAGTPFATASTMTANVDFTARSIGFTTSDMTLVNINNDAQTTRADLRLSGTLGFPFGNSFSGNVTTAHTNTADRLSGTASGRFYGPAAQEIGGVYTLSRGTRESMIGGFGGKR